MLRPRPRSSCRSTLRDSGMPGVGMGVALDDGLVCARASGNVVGLDGEDLLEDIGCSECLEGPYLHLSETLASETVPYLPEAAG